MTTPAPPEFTGSAARAAWWPPTRLFLEALAGWLLLAPLTWVLPRDPRRVLFHGRDGGRFIDNCKHLFVAVQARTDLDIEPVYLVRDSDLRDRLRAKGARAELVGGAAGLWRLLRAGTLVVDSIDWNRGPRHAATRGARVVQLWHGIPLKQVQLPLFEARLQRLSRPMALLLRAQRAVIGRFPRTAWMLSTSPLVTERAFAPSFDYDRISHAGYPRNDCLLRRTGELVRFGIDADAATAVAAFRAAHPGRLVGIYAPTFRDSLADPFVVGQVDLTGLSGIAERLGLLLLVKLHPWMHGRARAHALPGLHFVAPESDVYPLLRETDFLLTDYSSIFFDYLLLDRPVLFFPYDLHEYLATERPMYFDYHEMTPGPKANDLAALESALAAVVAGHDDWRDDRARVRSLVFEHADGNACERLIAELFPHREPTA